MLAMRSLLVGSCVATCLSVSYLVHLTSTYSQPSAWAIASAAPHGPFPYTPAVGHHHSSPQHSDHSQASHAHTHTHTDAITPTTYNEPQTKHKVKSCCLDDAFQDPLLSTFLFFDKCPNEIHHDSICEAVGRALGMPNAALFARTDVNVTSFIHAPARPHLKPTVHFTSEFDIAVVHAGLCFNIYPSVKYGTEVPFECQTHFGKEPLSILKYSNIFTPGNFYYENTITVGIARGVHIGGDLEGYTEPLEVNFDEAIGGCFPTHPLIVGGNIWPSDESVTMYPMTTVGITPALGGTDSGSRLANAYTPLTEEQVNQVVFEMAVKACALSKSIQSRRPNGSVTFTPIPPPGFTEFAITCPGDNPFCVVEPDGPLVSTTVIHVTVNLNAAEVVKINVPGLVQFAPILFRETFTIPLIWNFYEADDVTIILDNSGSEGFVGSILAPRASSVAVYGSTNSDEVHGSVVMGHPESHLLFIDIANSTAPSDGGYCPPPEPEVVVCDCLCRKKKQRKLGARY